LNGQQKRKIKNVCATDNLYLDRQEYTHTYILGLFKGWKEETGHPQTFKNTITTILPHWYAGVCYYQTLTRWPERYI